MSARSSGGASSLSNRAPPSRTKAPTRPTPSTCPVTRCPSSGSPTRKLFSRLSASPLFQNRTVVLRCVSGIYSKNITPSSMSATVEQIPLRETLSPTRTFHRAGFATATRNIPRDFRTERTVPTSLIIPVNIRRHRRLNALNDRYNTPLRVNFHDVSVFQHLCGNLGADDAGKSQFARGHGRVRSESSGVRNDSAGFLHGKVYGTQTLSRQQRVVQ